MKWGYVAATGVAFFVAGVGQCSGQGVQHYGVWGSAALGLGLIALGIWGAVYHYNEQYDVYGQRRK